VALQISAMHSSLVLLHESMATASELHVVAFDLQLNACAPHPTEGGLALCELACGVWLVSQEEGHDWRSFCIVEGVELVPRQGV